MPPKRKTESIAISVVSMAAFAVLVFFVIKGSLAPRTFAIDCAIVMIISTLTWTFLLKRTRSDADALSTTSAIIKSSYKTKDVEVAVLLLLLFVSFGLTRGGPWAPRLIGASILVLFLIGTILRKAK